MVISNKTKVILCIWALLIAFYGITRFYQLKWNGSSSLPQKLWLLHVDDKNLKTDDYVMIKFHDYRMSNPADYYYVIKQVGGVPGDIITVRNWVGLDPAVKPPNKTSYLLSLPNGSSYPTYDTLSGYHFTPLTTVNMRIPEGCYFVHGTQQPSWDSRYKEFGLVCESEISGKAYPIF